MEKMELVDYRNERDSQVPEGGFPYNHEYMVAYPAHIYLMTHRKEFFLKQSMRRMCVREWPPSTMSPSIWKWAFDYKQIETELLAKGYVVFRDLPTGFLWRDIVHKRPYAEYVFIFFEDRDGYAVPPRAHDNRFCPVVMRIPGTEDLLSFAYHYHIPLIPQTPEERTEFIRCGYEFVEDHLQAIEAWNERQHFHALMELDEACGYARNLRGHLRWELKKEDF